MLIAVTITILCIYLPFKKYEGHHPFNSSHEIIIWNNPRLIPLKMSISIQDGAPSR